MTTSPVTALTDELIADLDRSVSVVWKDTDSVVATLKSLLAEREELKRDAERYRWLRQACDDDPSNLGVEYGCSPGVDAAIDAAMQNQ